MNLAAGLPHKYYLNLDRRTDRRARCEAMFAELGWQVTRQAAVDAQKLKSARRFESRGRYAHALSTRMILRRAALAGAEAVLILEDDVVFSPLLELRLAELELPEDWGILYLGCQHFERPEIVSPGLVRTTASLDTHAWVVRRQYFLDVRRAMRGQDWPRTGTLPAADILLARLTLRVPAFAAWPNLAWQEVDVSDLTGNQTPCGNYDAYGRQKYHRAAVAGLLAEMLGGTSHRPALETAQSMRADFLHATENNVRVLMEKTESPLPPLGAGERVAFLFLTRGQHLHPDMWTEYWAGQEERVSVYGHARERTWTSRPGVRDWLREAQIAEHVPAEWGDLSLVHAEMALLRAALQDQRNRFFIFVSESCVPVRPLRTLLHMLSLDGRCRMQVIPLALMEEFGVTPHKVERAPVEGHLPPEDWYFHQQWLLLNRGAVELLVANEVLLEHFAGTDAPQESAFCTILAAAGWPMEKNTVSQSITWLHLSDDEALHPDSYDSVDASLVGEIMGSGCFFARKFAAGSGVEQYHPHL